MIKNELLSQNKFIERLCKKSIPVSIFLTSGIKLIGQISDYDDYTIVLDNGLKQLIYKHAISTILPTITFDQEHQKLQSEKNESE